jgi:hypothetical protein
MSTCYAIILHNVRTYRSAGVVGIVRGKHKAEITLKEFADSQNSTDHHEGWRYFYEKTELAVGTNPAEATQLRQADLEQRESSQLNDVFLPQVAKASSSKIFGSLELAKTSSRF